MRIVFLTQTFQKKMGYTENLLPRYFAKLGHETHVLTTDLVPYFQTPETLKIYTELGKGSELKPGTVEDYDGYQLHVLSHRKIFGYMRMEGFWRKLAELKPDIVQTTVSIGWIALDGALAKPFLKYNLFTGNHTHSSVFPLAQDPRTHWNWMTVKALLTRAVPGRLTSFFSEKCFCTAEDCAEVARRFFGVQKKKIEIIPLGVDTELFWPVKTSEDQEGRANLRNRLGFKNQEIVCIYTGRFTEDKNPLLLASAIEELIKRKQPFRGLFLGAGPQEKAIQECKGCVTEDFTPHEELRKYYQASEIGVWPEQESMSMIDAAACGIPIVVNDSVRAMERVRGNGLTFKRGKKEDLVNALEELASLMKRRELGDEGARKAAKEFSWEIIAKKRLKAYEASLGKKI